MASTEMGLERFSGYTNSRINTFWKWHKWRSIIEKWLRKKKSIGYFFSIHFFLWWHFITQLLLVGGKHFSVSSESYFQCHSDKAPVWLKETTSSCNWNYLKAQGRQHFFYHLGTIMVWSSKEGYSQTWSWDRQNVALLQNRDRMKQ